MEDKNGKNILMVLLTALGGLAIVVLIGWVAFFNPLDNMNTEIKPELALSSLSDGESELLPQKSAEELLLDGLQKGEDTPLIIEEEADGEIVLTMEEDSEPEQVVETPAAFVKPAQQEVVKKVVYKDITEPIYWLQVGSFPNSVSADKLRSDLKEKGIDSVMQTRTVNDTLYYRVRVGAFSNKNEAENFKVKLLSLDEIEEVTLYTDSVTRTVAVD